MIHRKETAMPLPRLALALLVVLAASACASRPAPVAMTCSGPTFPLNPGQWTPTAEDLR